MGERLLSAEEAHRLCVAALVASRTAANNAEAVARALVGAELAGQGAVQIDAAYGFAYPALELAVARLVEIAPAQGVALAGIRRSHHAGVAGLTVEALAEKGLVALLFANAPPSTGQAKAIGSVP